MRTLQILLGLILVTFGLLFLASVNGWLALTALDIAGVCLLFSGVVFVLPGIAWRQRISGLTALFVPGFLAIALGILLIYAARVGWRESLYGWTLLPVALGLAFLAMYYGGLRTRPLWIAGIAVGGVGLFLLALFLAIIGAGAAERVVGSIVLVGLGAVLALQAVLASRASRAARTVLGPSARNP